MRHDRRETVFWLTAVVALPAVDVALVIALSLVGLTWRLDEAGGVLGILLAILVNHRTLRRLQPRGGGILQLAGGIAVALGLAAFACVILIVGVLAPAVA